MFHCDKCDKNKSLNEIVRNFDKNKCTYYIQKCCLECKNLYGRNYKKGNKKILKQQKEYKIHNREKIQLQRKEYHKQNKEITMKYKKQNPEIVKKCRTNFYKKNKENIIRITNFYKRMRKCLFKKSDVFNRLIQCSPNYFRKWIDFQLTENMNINNYGTKWELDHVIPLIILDKESFHWQNIRPCFCDKNKIKKDKIILYENVLQELKLYHFNKSLLSTEGNFWRRTRLIAVPNSKKEIYRDNPQPSF